jgi:hypothetical protein
MHFSLSDHVVSEFLSGLVAVAALVVVGCIIALILKKMIAQYPFIRMALVLALTPLSLVQFLDQDSSTLYLYAMIVIPLGLAIDGINHLLRTKENAASLQQHVEYKEQKKDVEQPVGPDSDVIVWEKAE